VDRRWRTGWSGHLDERAERVAAHRRRVPQLAAVNTIVGTEVELVVHRDQILRVGGGAAGVDVLHEHRSGRRAVALPQFAAVDAIDVGQPLRVGVAGGVDVLDEDNAGGGAVVFPQLVAQAATVGAKEQSAVDIRHVGAFQGFSENGFLVHGAGLPQGPTCSIYQCEKWTPFLSREFWKAIPRRTSRERSTVGQGHFALEPCPGVCPPAVRGSCRNVERLGDLLDGEAGEKAQLDQSSVQRMFYLEASQCFIEADQLVVALAGRQVRQFQVDSRASAAVPVGLFAAGVLSPASRGRQRQKVLTVSSHPDSRG
jgi:hypothetical protein